MQENNKNAAVSKDRSINMLRLMRTLWKRVWLIVLVTAVAGAAVFICSEQFIAPSYQSYFTAYVNNRHSTVEGQVSTSSADITASKNLTYLYQEIICSRSVLTDAGAACSLEDTYAMLQNRVSTSVSENAAIITVAVRAYSPEEAKLLADAIAEVAPVHVERIVEGSSMRIVDYPVLPQRPSAPNSGRNAVIGALAALVITVIIVILMDLINDRVDSAAEVEERYAITVVGVIPDLLHADKLNGNTAGKHSRTPSGGTRRK